DRAGARLRGACRLSLGLALLLAAGCASRTPTFGPAGIEDSRRALDAWRDALQRADSLGPARLLYDARMSPGMVRMPGTLAVEGVLEVSQARLATLSIVRPEADLLATYSGRLDPWPERIALEDRRTGRRLELTLVAREPADPSPTSP